jgi:hypothetical protein
MPIFSLTNYSLVKVQPTSEDSIPIFWLVFHPLEHHLGYDDNRFLNKPYLFYDIFDLT